jgi:hypothetical protein
LSQLALACTFVGGHGHRPKIAAASRPSGIVPLLVPNGMAWGTQKFPRSVDEENFDWLAGPHYSHCEDWGGHLTMHEIPPFSHFYLCTSLQFENVASLRLDFHFNVLLFDKQIINAMPLLIDTIFFQLKLNAFPHFCSAYLLPFNISIFGW